MANTGWKFNYINSLPEEHLIFAFHYLKKKDDDYWARFGAHMGTVWDREELERLTSAPSGSPSRDRRVFVPLSLVVNPDLPEALLGKGKANKQSGSSPRGTEEALPASDGLQTGMSLPLGTEIVNMANLPKEKFMEIIRQSGLAGATRK